MEQHYIPEPQPVLSDVEVTALYYPGTDQMAEWDMIAQTRPGIRPLLGWYDEGNPENVDWQIKWAVEHGISNFCVDWYWNQGEQRLDHWVRAFYQARFKSYLKWFIMWANHNQPGAHSTADMQAVVRFWLTRYFNTPEYYTIDGKPVVTLWSMENIDNDFIAEAARSGKRLARGEGLKLALKLCRELVKEAGLPGIFFLGMYHVFDDYPALRELALAGNCDALMMYNCGQNDWSYTEEELAQCEGKGRYSFSLAADCARRLWKNTALDRELPVWPILPAGWDDRPRSFQQGRVVCDRTPGRFRQLCSDCHDFCTANGLKHAVVAPVNEWQEGTYIEPNAEYGFGMYDALREGFCRKQGDAWPLNLQPSSVGRPLLEFPPLPRPALTEWNFEHDTLGWYRNPYGTAHLRVIAGALQFQRSYSPHAAIRCRPAPFDAEKFSRFRVQMCCTPHPAFPVQGTENVKLYWGSAEYPVFTPDLVVQEEATDTVPLIADGAWHEYTIELAGHPRWRGRIEELWFDSGMLLMSDVRIKWMKFEK